MSELLVSRPGFLSVVANAGVPSVVKFGLYGLMPPLPFISSAALIQGVSADHSTNTRFQQGLDQNVYVYSFGDRPTAVTVSGLAFEGRCGGLLKVKNPLTKTNLITGLDEVMMFYKMNRVSMGNLPVVVVIGLTSIIRGYLVGINVATHSTEMRTMSWTMRITGLPGGSLGLFNF